MALQGSYDWLRRNLSLGQPSNPLNLILATGALFALVGQALLLFTERPEAENR